MTNIMVQPNQIIYFGSVKKVNLKEKYLYTWSSICEKHLHYQFRNVRIIVAKKKDKRE